jgi:hypothetical protein
MANCSRSFEYRRTTVLEGECPSIAAVAISLPVAAITSVATRCRS